MYATRLHKFCINEGGVDNVLTNDASQNIPNTIFYITVKKKPSAILNNSTMRDIVVEEIARMGLSRPAYNLEQNKIWFEYKYWLLR